MGKGVFSGTRQPKETRVQEFVHETEKFSTSGIEGFPLFIQQILVKCIIL